MIFRLIVIAAGVWLVFAPAVLGYDDPAAANDRLVGPAVAGAAFVAIWSVVRPVRWLAAPFGAWMVVAPFLLGYHPTSATISSIVTGIVVLVATPPEPADPERFGGGWRALVGREQDLSSG